MNFILLGFVYSVFFYRRWRRKSLQELVINSLLYIYLVMVLFVTIMPYPIPFASSNNLFMDTANFIPFRDLMMNYDGAVREIILNVIMMMPFGFLFPLIKKKGIFITVGMTFLFSFCIESLQLLGVWWGSLYTRSFDVTDLITNTFGGLFGYLIYIIFKPFMFKILKG